MTTRTTWHGPCEADPARWDLDAGSLVQWLAARRTCLECPVLNECAELLAQEYPERDLRRKVAGNPKAVIWAGSAFSESGVPLDVKGLRLYAARQRPTAEPTAEFTPPVVIHQAV